MSDPTFLKVPRNQILIGDARQRLRELPNASVDCVITSPPYFGLRNYGMAAQLGLEPNVEAWVGNLRDVCRQLARILKPTGSLWLNVGDGYSAHIREGAQVKSLLLAPERLAIALARDGWIVRNQVIWYKSNAMPHSVRDRLSNSHEIVFLLTRGQRYFFDLDAIRVSSVPSQSTRRGSPHMWNGYPPTQAVPGDGRVNRNQGLAKKPTHPLGKNPGDVWSIATAGFRGAHFATFPVRLIEKPLLATCPERICTSCGQPWTREPYDRSRAIVQVGDLRPSCSCDADTQPGLVLDPFLGSGTVALAAEQHRREWLGIELNPDYAALSQRRLAA
jgi:DNA modification methylase